MTVAGNRSWRIGIPAALVAALLVAVGLVWGRSPAAVDWRDVRAVTLESDDWGLCGFVPADSALAGLDRAAVAPGRFPEVYWRSTLEDSAQVARLCAVLASVRGRDGLPAVLQPNYITASLSWEQSDSAAATGHWRVRDLPDLPPAYARPGMWAAVRSGLARGVWHPELHGRWHYDPDRRRAATASSGAAREAARRDLLLFPGSARAWELGPWRDRHELAGELDRSLDVFVGLFDRRPRSIIAPDYHWDDRCEDLWLAAGLRTIQAHRGQRQDAWRGTVGRARKLLHRVWSRQTRPDRVYLLRNCLFEPVQHPQPGPVVRDCLAEIRAAWRRGEPAVVETHRINFVHLDPAVAATGRAALQDLLTGLTGAPGSRPTYLVDGELAGLQRRGTSWRVVDDHVVVRNLTRTRRVVVVPPAVRADLARRRGEAGVTPQPLLVSLAPGEVRRLAP